MEITVKDKQITLKNTFRSMLMYENIMDATFTPKGVTEILVYFYCVILASEKDLEFTYDEFLDWLDENNDELGHFSQWLVKQDKQQAKIKKK